jgi:hypothetical protein
LGRYFGLRETRCQGAGGDFITRSFLICLLTKCNLGDHIKKDEMERAFGMYGLEERCIYGFGWETLRKETTWKT